MSTLPDLWDQFTVPVLSTDEEPKVRLKSVTDMLKTSEIDWIVDGHIHRSGLTQLYGASYTGKTLVVLDLIMSWCAGLTTWQGLPLCNNGEPQQAVYVAAEGGAALSVHVDAWLKYHQEVDRSLLDGLVFLDGGEGDHVFLGIGKEQPNLEDSWTRLSAEMNQLEVTPSIMVFDTQIDLAPGIDENSNTDMVGILRRIKRLGDSSGFMAIVVHHTGHDGNKARGASGMMGKCDAQAKLVRIGEGKASLEWMKVKGRARPQETFSYQITGQKLLPELDSEGAVCAPLSKQQASIAQHQSKCPSSALLQGIKDLLTRDSATSRRAIAESMGINKDSTPLKDALLWMENSNLIEKTGAGRSSGYTLAALSMVPDTTN
ncbi:AAA family ATPase [Arthrobacter sp. TMT4-20]